jgi:hypothetical protein
LSEGGRFIRAVAGTLDKMFDFSGKHSPSRLLLDPSTGQPL